MKFGLRIHWGLYASGDIPIGPESWPLNRDQGKNQTFLKWYWDQAQTWNPKAWNPKSWIDLMKRSGTTFFDFTTKHHEGFSMYDTKTRVHDCWDFDLTPGAKTVKGIVPCNSSSTPVTFTMTAHTKSTAKVVTSLQNITLVEAKAACTADANCAGFDFYEVDDTGKRCGAPGACAMLKYDVILTSDDESNALYTKIGGKTDDGVAFSSMEHFGRDIVGELVAAAREGGIIPGLYFSNIGTLQPHLFSLREHTASLVMLHNALMMFIFADFAAPSLHMLPPLHIAGEPPFQIGSMPTCASTSGMQ
jgi:hypothetical protein